MNKFSEILVRVFERARTEIPGFEAEMADDLPLFDVPGAVLDSFSLVSFAFIVEEEFRKGTGRELKITNDDVLASDDPPFRSVADLRNYLEKKQ